MSHFSVLVIGPDPESQIAPYHEFECTGKNDQYVLDVDITDEVRKEGLEYHGLEDKIVASEIEVDRDGKHQSGYAIMDGHTIVKAVNRTNPSAKWDWYQVGGRWTGAMKLKPNKVGVVGSPGLMTQEAPSGYADQALKGDIDFEQKRNDAEVKARALWTLSREITGGAAWDTWDDTRSRYPDIDTARREYFSQPSVELLKASGKEAFRWEIDDSLALELPVYIQRARDRACVQFAFVRDSLWAERGKMGWWAIVTDEVSEGQWYRMFNDMLDALPDDTLLTIVDCHI